MAITPTPPATIAQFKAQYAQRGFNFGEGPGSVTDSDITLAMTMASSMWNPALWNSGESIAIFCLVVAHFIVTNIQAVGGLNSTPTNTPGAYSAALGNTGNGMPIDSKSVDKVHLKYAGLEKLIDKYPMLAGFRSTDFGSQYCLLVAPRLVGRVNFIINQQDPGAVIPAVPFLG